MTHLNFGTNNGKPAVVTWGLGDEGGKLRLAGGGTLSLGGAVAPQHPPNDAPDNPPKCFYFLWQDQPTLFCQWATS